MKPRLVLLCLFLAIAACAVPSIQPSAPATQPTSPPLPAANPPPAETLTSPSPTPDWLVSDIVPPNGKGQPPKDAQNNAFGPWATRIMLATSPDGLTFTRTNQIVSDQGGVPNVIVDRDGRTRVYYVAYGNGNIIAVAIQKSPDEWVYRKVLISGLPGKGNAVDPFVMILPDGRYRLYFMHAAPTPIIYSAASDDGIHFATEEGMRFSPGEAVFDPAVLFTGSEWLMWVNPPAKYIATSPDGLTFTNIGEFYVEGRRFMPWSAANLPGGSYRLYGHFEPNPQGIASVFSTDGKTWTADPGLRLTSQGGDPALEKGVAPDNGAALLPDGAYLLAYLAGIP